MVLCRYTFVDEVEFPFFLNVTRRQFPWNIILLVLFVSTLHRDDMTHNTVKCNLLSHIEHHCGNISLLFPLRR